MELMGLFGAVALALVTVGIYGLLSYTVRQRAHEIGVRMALGSRPAGVLRLIVTDGLSLTAVGIGVGLAASLGLTRFLSGLLFGVGSADPMTFMGVAVLLMLVALLASYIPARRAAHVDPLVALRDQ
jgi:putative ABC transport system permease protein